MTRARDLSRLANNSALSADSNGNVGVGSTQPKSKLNVVGVVSATSFYGDGTNLSNTGSTLSAASGSQRVVLTSLTSGTMTASSTDANVTYNATTQTLSVPNVSIAGTLTYEDVTNVDSVGLITARNGAIINAGTATTALIVSGNARVTGILTIGTSSVTLDGTNNQVNVGTGVTLHHTNGVQVGGNTVHSTGLTVNQINVTGVVTATSFSGNGSGLTGIAATANVRTNSLVVSGVSTFATGSADAPSILVGTSKSTGFYSSSTDINKVGIARSGFPAITITGANLTEISPSYRTQVRINEDESGAMYATTNGTEVFRVRSFSESTSGTNYGSVFTHAENGYKPSNTSITLFSECRSFGTGYAVYARTGGNGAAGYFYSGGGPYSEGNGVYARVDHTDSNGPGWQAGVYAYGATVGGPAIAAGGAGALHAIVNNHYNSDPVIKCESQYSGAPTRTAVQFIRNNSTVGSITFTLSATAYNTSSDYRLKENIVSLENAEQRLRQIPVHRFNFIEDPGKTVDGFIAHEVTPYVPEAVYGEKDATETRIVKDEEGKDTFDEDGNPILETVPKYQGIDQSKLVPLLTAALQEAFDKIDNLQSRVEILESS